MRYVEARNESVEISFPGSSIHYALIYHFKKRPNASMETTWFYDLCSELADNLSILD